MNHPGCVDDHQDEANPPVTALKASVRCQQGRKQAQESERILVRKEEANQNQAEKQVHELSIDTERSNKSSNAQEKEESSRRRPAENEEVASIDNAGSGQPEEYGTPSSRLKRNNTTPEGNGSDDLRQKKITHQSRIQHTVGEG